jgi:excisionase family DNA binding protein
MYTYCAGSKPRQRELGTVDENDEMTARTARAPTLAHVVNGLRRDIAELRARVDALDPSAATALTSSMHSKERLAWAARHGIDLEAIEPFHPAPLGTHTMTVAEAARELGLSLEQVRRHLRSGRLRGTPLGGRAGWRVSRADVAQFNASRHAITAGRTAVD